MLNFDIYKGIVFYYRFTFRNTFTYSPVLRSTEFSITSTTFLFCLIPSEYVSLRFKVINLGEAYQEMEATVQLPSSKTVIHAPDRVNAYINQRAVNQSYNFYFIYVCFFS